MSGFDIKKLASFFPKKAINTTGLVFCEAAVSSDNSPKHIRKITSSGLFHKGGSGGISLCGTKVSQDTSEVESLFVLEQVQSKSQPSNQLCQKCIHDARLLLNTK